ncbi:hypothetical protein BVX97_02110 [bacterium E08(2017)]|nr:hypothetical protein BVX97_02110 [bacterium E08(2017)]
MRKLLYVLVLVVLATSVMAGGMGVSVKGGTLGFGADVGIGVVDMLSLRLGFSKFSIGESFNDEDTDDLEGVDELKFEINLESINALVDFYPFKGAFRITAGMLINNNEFTAEATSDERIDINGVEYRVERADGLVSWSDMAPYVGIGGGNVASGGKWHWGWDLGVMFQGSPEIELTATASNAQLQQLLNQDIEEEVKQLEEDAESFNMYPVATISFGYRFF